MDFTKLKGKLIEIDGGEGAGKTTLLRSLQSYFQDKPLEVVFTREPGGTQISEEIRNIVLDKHHVQMKPITEMLLFAAARHQHVEEKIRPALERGALVMTDRFVTASLVYQGIVRGIGIEQVLTLNQFALQGIMPNQTIVLDIDPAVGLRRVSARGELNRLDAESIAFHQQIREGYRTVQGMFPDRVVLVNAERDRKEVWKEVLRIIKKT